MDRKEEPELFPDEEHTGAAANRSNKSTKSQHATTRSSATNNADEKIKKIEDESKNKEGANSSADAHQQQQLEEFPSEDLLCPVSQETMDAALKEKERNPAVVENRAEVGAAAPKEDGKERLLIGGVGGRNQEQQPTKKGKKTTGRQAIDEKQMVGQRRGDQRLAALEANRGIGDGNRSNTMNRTSAQRGAIAVQSSDESLLTQKRLNASVLVFRGGDGNDEDEDNGVMDSDMFQALPQEPSELSASCNRVPSSTTSKMPGGDEGDKEDESSKTVCGMSLGRFGVLLAFLVLLVAGGVTATALATQKKGDDSSITPPTIPGTKIPTPSPTPPVVCDGSLGPLDNLAQAHRNCLCMNVVGDVSDEIVLLHTSLKSADFLLSIIPEDFDEELDSCDQNNVALYWLAEDIVKNDTPENKWQSRFLLASLFLYWTGDDPFLWKAKTGWMSDEDVCVWFGVTCDTATGEIIHLKLSNNNLLPSGGLPDALFELTMLQYIDLSFNELEIPSIPTSIFKLQNLEFLNLGYNSVSGPLIFDWFPTSLVSLNLQATSIFSSIPPSIGTLTNLEILDLTSASITGTLPSALSSLTKLRRLLLGENYQLEIGFSIWALTSLETINIANTPFFVSVPSEIGKLTNLVEIDANNLFGILPTEIGLLTNMQVLKLQGESSAIKVGLSGGIPSQIGLLSKLDLLDLSRNDISGKIPSEIGQLGALRRLDLSLSLLTGTIPTEMAAMGNLEAFNLGGRLPAGSGSLGLNLLVGTIPSAFVSLTNLVCLDVGGTLVTGTIPEGLCDNKGTNIFINCAGSIATCDCCSCESDSSCAVN